MIADLEGNEIVSNEDALAIMFAGMENAESSVPQPHRHRIIDRAIRKIVTQFEVELSIPWVKGRFSNMGATVIHLDEPDFSQHTKLYDPNSFGVIEIHMENGAENGDSLIAGFDAYIRLGESSTWFCIGIRPPSDNSRLLDFSDFGTETDNELAAQSLDDPLLSDENQRTLCDIAAQIATADGFGSVALRVEPRERFAAKFVRARMGEFIDLDCFTTEQRIVFQASYIARNYWEFGVVPMRAKELNDSGKSASQIAKELGITKQRAERALELDIESGINSKAINSLLQNHKLQ